VEVDRPPANLVGELFVDLSVGEDLAAAIGLEVKPTEAVVIDFVGAVQVPAEARPKTAVSRGGARIAHHGHSSKPAWRAEAPEAAVEGGVPASRAARRSGADVGAPVRSPRKSAPARSSGFRPLAEGRGAPEGIPAGDWRRLRVMASWAAAAGHPIRTLTRAVSYEAPGVLTIEVASPRWARELGPHLETLRERVARISGERVASIVLRADPRADPRS